VRILHIDSSVQGGNSFSRKISADVMEKLKARYPDAIVTYRDFGKDPVPHLTEVSMAATQGLTTEHEPDIKAELALSAVLLEEFLSADVIVIGTAFYNLTVSSALKAWIDRLLIVGKTFRYTPEGELEGMMGDKKVVLCISRGGYYNEGAPGAAIEHCESYLRAIFAFIGVQALEVIAADGVSIGPEHRSQAETDVKERIEALEL